MFKFQGRSSSLLRLQTKRRGRRDRIHDFLWASSVLSTIPQLLLYISIGGSSLIVTTLLIKVGKNEDVEVEKYGSPKTLIIKKKTNLKIF